MMPDNDEGRRSIVITFNLKILVIVIVTVAVTFLFIRSNQTMRNTPTLVKTVYNTDDAGLVANNSGNRLVLTAVNLTMDTNSTKNIVTDHQLSQKHDGMLKNDQEMFISLAKQQILNTDVQEIKEFRSIKPELIQDDYVVVKPPLYRKKLNRYMTDSEIDKSMPINVDDNKSEVTVKNGMYQMDTAGSNSVNHEYSTIDVNIPLSDENSLNSHYNLNDSSYNSYNTGIYTYKEIEIPVDEIKLVTDGQSEQINTMDNLSQVGSGSYDYRPHSYYDFKARYPTGQAYRPLVSIPMKNRQPSKQVPDEENHKPIFQQPSKISFKNNSALLLIKLGILKLKMIGILQIVFLLGFKLKLFIITIFTKFLLLMKLMKFYKIIMMPVILLSSLPVLGSILNGKNNSSASSQSSLLSALLPNLSNNMEESSSSGSSSSSTGSSSSSSSSFPEGSSSSSFSSFTIPSDIPPDLLGLLLPGLSRESGGRIFLDKTCDSNNILLPDLSLGKTNQTEIEHPYFTSKVQDSNTFNRKQYKSFDPFLTISQKILDSEKCVQSIACRLAVAEKIDIIPVQIKLWILNGVSKLIPEEKYELYFKTYNFIKNEIETTNPSLTTDNWSEWCLERYNSDNITNRLK